MTLSPGDRVDRYEVIELLGVGGMGEVYRARDPKLARDVALKILHVDRSGGAEPAERLLREARAAAALSHANVLAVYDVGDVREPERLRGLSYIAMELVVGEPLRAYVGDDGVPLERRIGWLRDVASALGAAHKAGVVHRDVKPENVMIRVDGAVKVLDFGIARRAAVTLDTWSSKEGHAMATAPGATLPTLTGQGVVVGTPFYMAPEQLRGEAIDARADQFAWGVVAYSLLTGKVPWVGGTEPLTVLSQILSVDPAHPCEVDARVPAALSAVVMRTLAKERTARFASMGEVIDAMDAASGSVASTGDLQRSGRSPAPVPAAVTSAPATMSLRRLATGAAFALAGAGATFWGSHARRSAPPTGAPSAVPAPAAADGAGCSTNAECVHAHGGAAWHCNRKRHACVEIASQDCKVYSEPGDPEADDVVWIGGMFPLHGEPGLLCESRAAELARQDFVAALGPSSARAGALHARPVGLVLCDEASDAMRAARHLAQDVEVPAVLGFRSTATALSTLSSVLLPARVLAMVTISQAPAVMRVPEPPGEKRLVWRTTLDRVEAAVPLARFISEVLEPRVRAEPGGLGSARPMKVAAVWSSRVNHDFVDGLFDALHFNGKSALDNGADFRQFVLDADGGPPVGDVAGDLLAFGPQVVVVGTHALYDDAFPRLESDWGKSARGPRPIYVTESSLAPEAAAFAGRDPDRRRRFFAITNVATTPTNAKLVLRYNLAFPAEPVVRTEAPQPSYDAFYALAYATYALGDAPVTGPALAGALERLLPPGPKIDVGPGAIFDGFDALRAGGRIDLNGAIGSLDFDPSTGDAPIDYAIDCLGVDDHGRASAAVDSGLVYDARAKKLVGTLRCP